MSESLATANYLFQEAELEDLPMILSWTEALMEHEALEKSIELPLKDNISLLIEEWLKKLITDENSLIIIAIEKDQKQAHGLIIGYLQLQPNEFTIFNTHGVIQLLWVVKEQRRKGLALQLLNQMEDTFKNLQIPYCEIQYSTANKEAEDFWAKSGYLVVSHNSRKMLNVNKNLS